jgi:hypothetical protein
MPTEQSPCYFLMSVDCVMFDKIVVYFGHVCVSCETSLSLASIWRDVLFDKTLCLVWQWHDVILDMTVSFDKHIWSAFRHKTVCLTWQVYEVSLPKFFKRKTKLFCDRQVVFTPCTQTYARELKEYDIGIQYMRFFRGNVEFRDFGAQNRVPRFAQTCNKKCVCGGG